VELGRVMKHVAAIVVDKALGRRALGENHLMPGELDVEIFDLFDFLRLDNARAVDQPAGRHQRAVEIERVLGRHPQIARRHPIGERPGRDADRQHRRVASPARKASGTTLSYGPGIKGSIDSARWISEMPW
jgi:hypothetical protein